MNERIKELAEQSGGEFWQRLENDVVKENAYITFDPPESLEKFVELIVEQCFRVALVEGKGYLDPVKLRNAMKQDFGVE